MNFKVGDKVKVIDSSSSYFGKVYTISDGDVLNNHWHTIENGSCWDKEGMLQLISETMEDKILGKLTEGQKTELSTGSQAFLELGIVDSYFNLTSMGRTYVINFLLNKYRKEIEAQAIAEVKAIKAAKKSAK